MHKVHSGLSLKVGKTHRGAFEAAVVKKYKKCEERINEDQKVGSSHMIRA